jgi:hypothetical protein
MKALFQSNNLSSSVNLPQLPGNHFFNLKNDYQKNQIFSFTNSVCLEKPNFSSLRFNKNIQTEKDKETQFYKENQVSPFKHKLFNLRNSVCNTSEPRILPQWMKFDKKILNFSCYFNESIEESNVETYRIREFSLRYFLEDDTIQINEIKSHNSGMQQGIFLKRQRLNNLSPSEMIIGQNIYIYGKNFHIIAIDQFTRDFFLNSYKIEQPQNKEIPSYIHLEKQKAMKDQISYKDMKKELTELKDFVEVKLGGGKPNKALKQFLENDRKVLSFDILWKDDQDKEDKQYKMNYFLADSQIEIREVKYSNSGKDNYSYLVKKGKIAKEPIFTHIPGIKTKETEVAYKPDELLIGNTINIFNRKCLIFNCDDYTKKWFKDK